MDLVVMAAGMGSRFGGLKQTEPVGKNGEFIIDYSVFDAIKVGFDRVVFIIKEENYELFRDTVGKRIEDKIKVEYVFQKLDNLPEGFSVPEGREKPLGTAHAVYCCKDIIKGDFVTINADDFYGAEAYNDVMKYAKKTKFCRALKKFFTGKDEFALVGYKAENTLSENGSSKRGICKIENGKVCDIVESVVEKRSGKIFAKPLDKEDAEEVRVDGDQMVSMNMWFCTKRLFDYIDVDFPVFLKNMLETNPLKGEYLLPNVIGEALKAGFVNVRAVKTDAIWQGITYKEDKPKVVKYLQELAEKGVYPENLWQK